MQVEVYNVEKQLPGKQLSGRYKNKTTNIRK